MIKIDSLSKYYKIYPFPKDRLKQFIAGKNRQYYQKFWALKQLSIDIAPGEIIGLIGANGSGKSTLLQLIAGILQPSTGTISISGKVAALLELGAGFNPNFTGHENLYLNASLLGLSNTEIKQKYDQIVAFADISDFLTLPIRNYSSGMVMRLAFAIAAHVDAEVLIIDEALSVGDVQFQSKCIARMDELKQQGCTIILASHDQRLIKKYCSRAIYLNHGKLILDAKPERVMESYLRDVFENKRNQLSPVTQKQNNINEKAIRFGTEFGKLNNISMWVSNQHQAYCHHGDRICFQLDGWLSQRIQDPRLMLIVRDYTGYNIYSYDNLYAGKKVTTDTNGYFKAEINFDCLLQEGDYFVTLRLDEHHGSRQFSLIEKQVNAISFKVIQMQRTFDAVVNLNGNFNLLSTDT